MWLSAKGRITLNCTRTCVFLEVFVYLYSVKGIIVGETDTVNCVGIWPGRIRTCGPNESTVFF